MADTGTVEIPDRPVFKASEVCELVKVQPYVLRTWEAEFPELGEAKTNGGARVYRRDDVERVLRIKHLLLVEGLTLAGARRRMETDDSGDAPAAPASAVSTPSAASPAAARHVAAGPPPLSQQDRERIRRVKSGLQSLLTLLDDAKPAIEAEPAGEPREFTLELVDDGLPAPPSSKGMQTAKTAKGAPAKGAASPKRRRSS